MSSEQRFLVSIHQKLFFFSSTVQWYSAIIVINTHYLLKEKFDHHFSRIPKCMPNVCCLKVQHQCQTPPHIPVLSLSPQNQQHESIPEIQKMVNLNVGGPLSWFYY